MVKLKRIFIFFLIINLFFMSIYVNYKKAEAVAVGLSCVAWDLVCTILFCAAGYELYDVVTMDSTKKYNVDNWVASGNLTQEKIDFVKSHSSSTQNTMTDEKAKEFWSNINQKEFEELKNLYNSNRNPEFYDNNLNTILNLSIFSKIYEFFRKEKKMDLANLPKNMIFYGYDWRTGWYIETYKPNSGLRYAIVIEKDDKYTWYNTFEQYILEGGNIGSRDLGSVYGSYDHYISPIHISNIYFIGAPLFHKKSDAENYCKNGTMDGMVNKELYDDKDFIPINFAKNTKVLLPSGVSTLDGLVNELNKDPSVPSSEAIKQIVGREKPRNEVKTGTEEDSGNDEKFVNLDDFKLGDITAKFPFCIPFDLIHLIKSFNVKAEAPYLELPFKVPFMKFEYVIIVDFNKFVVLAYITRVGTFVIFVIGLIKATRGLIRG